MGFGINFATFLDEYVCFKYVIIYKYLIQTVIPKKEGEAYFTKVFPIFF